MNAEIKKLYYYEIDHAHLDFDADPVYQENMDRVLAELGTQELSPALFSLLNTANQISFTHGFRLGVSLVRWALRGYLQGFPPSADGGLLCPRRQSNQNAAGDAADGLRLRYAPPRSIGPLSPDPISRGPPIRPTVRSKQRRGWFS